jgi:hypothetical protein
MPTVECDQRDCESYGQRDGICIARRIRFSDSECLTYRPVEKMMNVRNPCCHKDSGGKYRSSRTNLMR